MGVVIDAFALHKRLKIHKKTKHKTSQQSLSISSEISNMYVPQFHELFPTQDCHIWVGSKFPDISLTIPWHIAIFPWQFILFFQVKNKNYPQKQFKGSTSVLNILPQRN